MNFSRILCSLTVPTVLLLNACTADEPHFEYPEPKPDTGIRHPMLFFNYWQGEQLRTAIHSTHLAQWTRFKAQADGKVRRDPPAYREDAGEQLWQREVGNTVAALAVAGYLTGDEAYFEAAERWALASCSYPAWGRDDTPDGMEYGLAYGHQLLGLAMLYDYGQRFLSEETLATLRQTMIARVGRQYAAYASLEKAYIQNHTWINVCGMLAAALVLRGEAPEAAKWIAFTQQMLEKSSRLLSPDGASQEGPGYWQYGMEFLMMAFDLSRGVGSDFYANSTWWKHTADYAAWMTLPADRCTAENSIVDWADAPRYAWYGPEHLYRRLAALNRDARAHYFADRAVAYDTTSSWLNLVWYDPSVSSVLLPATPTLRHFENMGLAAARTDWSGDESLVVFRCGAPLGTFAHTQPVGSYVESDMGHIHPDANHFILYANGEYVLRNNGYVKRQTKYHNTLLVNAVGQWGEVRTWFTPWPLTPGRDPRIVEASAEGEVVRIAGDASEAYADAAGVKRFVRKLVWLRKHDVVIVSDEVELAAAGNIELLFYPEQALSADGENAAESTTARNSIRIENLTPAQSTLRLGTGAVEERSSTRSEERPLVTIAASASSLRQVTALSWAALPARAPRVSYDAAAGTVAVGEETFVL
ncbi:DUF4962 domain-containing protein [Alistipes sp.]|uniref:DUF4962 domain-containing protein n=1 Tax=Alistipes sp. TaxID=1872444 RepID=UPI003AF020CD